MEETIIFDGVALAQRKEHHLKQRVDVLKQAGTIIKIAAILFTEDQGSQLYTRLKKEASQRVGVEYQVHIFSLRDEVQQVITQIQELNQDPTITGIIIQKPWRKTWMDFVEDDADAFKKWWQALVSQIDLKKDVDGLHPQTLASIKNGSWQEKGFVMPATARAVLQILDQAALVTPISSDKKVVVLGKSDILGKPLTYALRNRGFRVDMIGSKELRQRITSGQKLHDADIIVSSTGRHHLIGRDLVRDGVVVIDVGEPQPDVDFASVSPKAAFITPVPGGVGPMTVVCLVENALVLAR